MLPFLKGLLTGMAFGVVLYKVGASRYSRVMGMLTLRDTKVMKFAFFAIAVASCWYGLAAVLGVAESWSLVPRVMPFIGWAHVVGGVLFGASMGYVGFCPGTCAASVGGGSGAKKYTGLFAVMGLVAGVLVYAGIKDWLTQVGIIAEIALPITLHGWLGVSYGPLALAWAALFTLIALVIDRVSNEKIFKSSEETRSLIGLIRGEWSWVVSGFLGGTLIVLATAQDGYLGFSGAVLAAVGWASHLIGMPISLVPRIESDIIWRAALIVGVFPGGLLAKVLSIPSMAAVQEPLNKVAHRGI